MQLHPAEIVIPENTPGKFYLRMEIVVHQGELYEEKDLISYFREDRKFDITDQGLPRVEYKFRNVTIL